MSVDIEENKVSLILDRGEGARVKDTINQSYLSWPELPILVYSIFGA